MKTIQELLDLKAIADAQLEDDLDQNTNKITSAEMDKLLEFAANRGDTSIVVKRKMRNAVKSDLEEAGFFVERTARRRWKISW